MVLAFALGIGNKERKGRSPRWQEAAVHASTRGGVARVLHVSIYLETGNGGRVAWTAR